MTPELFPLVAPAFVGWHRPKRCRKWRRVVEGEDRAQVLSDLLDRTPGGSHIVMEGNRDPNVRR